MGKKPYGPQPPGSARPSSLKKIFSMLFYSFLVVFAVNICGDFLSSRSSSPFVSKESLLGSFWSFSASSRGEQAESCDASAYLGDETVPGFHVLCLTLSTPQTTSRRDSEGFSEEFIQVRGTVHLGGNAHSTPVSFVTSSPASSFTSLRTTLENYLQLRQPLNSVEAQYKQPWALFTPNGRRIESVEDARAQGPLLFLFEGGQFIWPGVRVGNSFSVELSEVGQVQVRTLSLSPLVLQVDKFFTEKEMDHVKETAEPLLQPSGVVLKDVHKGKDATQWRTSYNTFIASESEEMKSIDKRVEELTHLPISHQEDMQVLRYTESQKYSAHHDFFDPRSYAQNPDFLAELQHGHRNRLATVFCYLSDVEEGGETWFPLANMANEEAQRIFHQGMTEKDYDKCTGGLMVKPQRGSVIIFYSMGADGSFDPNSLHGGCPVKQGTKWAANKWVWNKSRVELQAWKKSSAA